MKKWLRRVRAAIGMGLTWAAGWALVGVLTGMVVDPTGPLVGMWIVVLGISSFLGGAVFSALLWTAEGKHENEVVELGNEAQPMVNDIGSLSLSA